MTEFWGFSLPPHTIINASSLPNPPLARRNFYNQRLCFYSPAITTIFAATSTKLPRLIYFALRSGQMCLHKQNSAQVVWSVPEGAIWE